MFDRFRQRSCQLEHLDKGDYSAEEYEACIVELQRVNAWLGDASALRSCFLAAVAQAKTPGFSLLDAGAGSGELLRVTAEWARRNGRYTRLVGLELNARSARAISETCAAFPEISSVRGDAFRLPFADNCFDYAICSLFTHHFTDDQVPGILKELSRIARQRIFVIDLHRHPLAYYSFTTLGHLLFHNRLIREDGALSILKGFKPKELRQLARRAGLQDIKVERKFPYRVVLSARKSFSDSEVRDTGSGSQAASLDRGKVYDSVRKYL